MLFQERKTLGGLATGGQKERKERVNAICVGMEEVKKKNKKKHHHQQQQTN